MKKLLGIGILILLCVCLFIFSRSYSPAHSPVWHLQNKDISLIVVDTPATRELGLGGRESLSENSAMFFIFDKPDIYPFWMKGMKFPIDIIWLDESYRIIYIESNLSPDTYPKPFGPSEKSLFVLETAAHFTEKNNLKVGETLNIDLLK
jgi:uncharacterized membrane protein (UPF0127 family)